MNKPNWSKEEDNILRDFYGKIKINHVQDKMPIRTFTSIRRRASQLRIPGNHKIYYKYSKNNNYFNEPNINNSYWAGFIAADGFIRKSSCSKQLGIMISRKDRYILEKFVDDIEFTGNIEDGEHGGYFYSRINIYGIKDNMWNALHNIWSITPRKSLTLKPPQLLSNEHRLSFIRGYLDGDGYISYRKHPKYKMGSLFILGILGTKDLLLWIDEVLTQHIPYKKHRKQPIYKKNNIFVLKPSGQRAVDIHTMLKNVKTPFILDRKWNVPYYLPIDNAIL